MGSGNARLHVLRFGDREDGLVLECLGLDAECGQVFQKGLRGQMGQGAKTPVVPGF